MRAIAVCVSILLAAGSTAAALRGDTWPDPVWTLSTPELQDLDSGKLAGLTKLIQEGDRFPDLHSLLIVRNGYLIVEEYFGNHSADDLHTLQSVSKSVTSALIGIAIKEGVIGGVDEKIVSFFPGVDIENLDDRKRQMTMEDLLTMRSGTDYREGFSGSPHSTLNRLDRGWDRFVLNRPMVRVPGAFFQYDSGGVILMSSILKRRTGVHADQFAEPRLFEPLGITSSRWYKNKEGHPHTGGGLHLRSRDMARFGLLYLRGGRWKDRQIVPADWVESSTRRQVVFDPPRGRSVGYGYLWWILPPDPGGNGQTDIYAAMGFRAQYIFVIPEHSMVVVVTGGTRSGADQRRPIDFLYSHILPAVER